MNQVKTRGFESERVGERGKGKEVVAIRRRMGFMKEGKMQEGVGMEVQRSEEGGVIRLWTKREGSKEGGGDGSEWGKKGAMREGSSNRRVVDVER